VGCRKDEVPLSSSASLSGLRALNSQDRWGDLSRAAHIFPLLVSLLFFNKAKSHPQKQQKQGKKFVIFIESEGVFRSSTTKDLTKRSRPTSCPAFQYTNYKPTLVVKNYTAL
jgi:hypothetical protein